MAVVQRTTTYAVCPSCGADAGAIDHLLGLQTETAWYCDTCGQRYRLVFKADGSVEITVARGRKVTTIDLLVLKPQEKPIYFIVEGMRFEDERWLDEDRTEAERKQFYYESHSCPTNWLKPEMMYFDGDADPHGLIEFVATRDASAFPEDEVISPNDHDRALLQFIETATERS